MCLLLFGLVGQTEFELTCLVASMKNGKTRLELGCLKKCNSGAPEEGKRRSRLDADPVLVCHLLIIRCRLCVVCMYYVVLLSIYFVAM